MDLSKLLKHRIQLARELSLLDWFTLTEAWWLLLLHYAALRVTSYDRLKDSAHTDDSPARRESRAQADAENLHRLIRCAARIHLIPMTCLVQSLTLQKMLNERNIPAQIKIGAQKSKSTLHAHAWVEVNNKPIGEADNVAQTFSIFAAVEMSSR